MISRGFLARVAASAVLRWVIFAALAAVSVWAGKANAASPYYEYPTREAAAAACQAKASTLTPSTHNPPHIGGCSDTNGNGHSGTHGSYVACLTNGGNVQWGSCWVTPVAGEYHWPLANGGCPAGTVWNNTTKTCFNSEACLSKNDALGSTAIAVSHPATSGCDSGCAMSMGTDYNTTTFTANGVTKTFFQGKMRYTGGACTVAPTKPPKSPEPECTAMDQQTVCKRADGKNCVSLPGQPASSICWNPGETGEKHEGPVKQVNNAGETPIPPNLSLPSGDTLAPVGPSTVVNSSTPGSPPKTNVINNYTTNYGTNAGTGPGSGIPTGDGSGSGEGDAGDDGDSGEEAGEATGPGEFPRMPGGDERTVSSVVGAYQTRVGNAPFVGAVSGFFTVQASGSCPTWALPATDFSPAMTMDFWCSPSLSNVWTLFGYVLLCVYGWVAFRWAVL